tara:strand:+ start:53687 stop:54439 length:753 start_codon:yes stop_codon:yes gene_type:complete
MNDQVAKFDIFVSYSSADKTTALQIAETLRNNRLRVWIDQWYIKPGDDIVLTIERALSRSRRQLILLSHSAVASDWVTLERNTQQFRNPSNQGRFVIPVRLDDCEIPNSLGRLSVIDFRTPSDAATHQLIIASTPILHTVKEGDGLIVYMPGQYSYESGEFHDEIKELMKTLHESEYEYVIIDLNETDIYPSTAMAVLMRFARVVDQRGLRIVAARPSELVSNLWETLSLGKRIPLYATLNNAHKALRSQ